MVMKTWSLTFRELKYLWLIEMKLLKNGESYLILNHVHCILRLRIRNLKSRRLRWVGHLARMKEFRNEFRILVGKPTETQTGG